MRMKRQSYQLVGHSPVAMGIDLPSRALRICRLKPDAAQRVVRWAVGLKRARKRQLIFAHDIVLCLLATFIAFALRVGALSISPGPQILVASVAVAAFVPSFTAFKVYSSLFRFAGLAMIFRLSLAVCVGSLPLVGLFMLWTVPSVPRTIALLQPIIFLLLLTISRIGVSYCALKLGVASTSVAKGARVLIYGAGSAGQQLALSMRHEPGMQVVGFIDDDPNLHHQLLDGVQVFPRDLLHEIAPQKCVDTIFLALPQISWRRRREIVESLEPLGLQVRTLPALAHLADGRITVNDLREIQIDDLLGREQIAPDTLLFARTIVGRTVMVTGAGGSIGGELCRQIAANGARRLILFEQSEFALYAIERELCQIRSDHKLDKLEIVPVLGSVLDRTRLEECFQDLRPDTVFHAAAYKHVPLVEANPVEGIRNNVLGTFEVVRASAAAGVKDFTLVSTDKAVRPTNVMGASKRCAEQVVQAYTTIAASMRISIVRFGNVLGSSGSVVPLFRAQIEAGGPLTVTHREITRYFMTIPEAAQLVIQAGGMARGGEVFVLDMGKPVKIAHLARTMIQLSGLSVKDAANPDGDIAIREIGLRPGEKLHEELLIGNDPQSTIHERIMMAREDYLAWDRLSPLLEALGETRDRAEALSILRLVVPDFAHDRDKALIERRQVLRA